MSDSAPEPITIRCGNCETTSSQKVVTTYKREINHADPDDETYWTEEWMFRLSLCPQCDTINLSVEEVDGGAVTILFPSPPEALEGLPMEVAKAYKAAQAVRRIDANAFAVLLGRALELVCLDRKAKGKTLSAQLQDLASKGEIPGPLAAMANQLRTLRNIGAHASLGELTTSEVPILDDLCRAVLEYVYAAPRRVAKVEERIKKLKSGTPP